MCNVGLARTRQHFLRFALCTAPCLSVNTCSTQNHTHPHTPPPPPRFKCECGMNVQFQKYGRFLRDITATAFSDRIFAQRQTCPTGGQRPQSHPTTTALLSRGHAVRQRSPPSASPSAHRRPASPSLLRLSLLASLASDRWPLFDRGTARPRPHHPNPIRLGPRRPRRRASCYTVAV